MDFPLGNHSNRIFLHLSNSMDMKMVQQYLSKEYSFVEEKNEQVLEERDYDLVILSKSKFKRYRQTLLQVKEELNPIYLPVILMTKEGNDRKYLKPHFWKVCDDILTMPVLPELLRVRIESLMRQRMSSLKMQEKVYLANKAIDATDVGVSITDSRQEDNPLIFLNKGFEKLTGYKKSEALGLNCRFLQGQETNQEGLKKLREAINSHSSAKVLLRNYRKDGTAFWNELSISPINGQDKRYFVGIQNDVTDLVEAQTELQELLDEKEILLQEIHHRIKNNLAVIVALMEMKIMDSENEETVSSLKEARTRIFSISQVHELLYRQGNLNKIDFDEYVEGLIEHLTSVYNETSKNIQVKMDLESFHVSLNQAVPCGMLLSELIANTFKHAFDHGEQGEVQVKVWKQSSLMFVKVTDNGKGLPSGKKLEEMPKFKQSILNVLLKQLQADWDYKSENGLEFKFNFELGNYTGIASQKNFKGQNQSKYVRASQNSS